MKILFLGDYSNLHACVAKELRRLGHTVHIVSDKGGYMDTDADFFLSRETGLLGGAKYLYRLFSLLPSLKGYDVVQLINSNFLKLRPGKISYFFDLLRRDNGRMFLTLAGNDYFFVKACADAKMFRFSEFKVGKEPTPFHTGCPQRMDGWISDANRRWSERLYSQIDGAISILPEYDMAARPVLGDKLTFTNLPVDLSSLPYSPLEPDVPVKIFIGMRGGMEIQKGTAAMLAEAKNLEREMPGQVAVQRVSNVSLAEYLRLMRQSHIVLDQLYSYSPATNALQAMALGRIAGSGAEPEYYEYIGNPQERPVLHLSPLIPDLKGRLRELIADPQRMQAMSEQGRRLVERHNDVRTVAPKWLEAWQR